MRRAWPTQRSATAFLIFFAFTTPFGIAAHLLSELVGLGWHADADVIFSPRHAYLAVLALVTLGGFVATLVTFPRDARRARVASLVDDLPFKGRGAGFTAISFAAQFGFFALTQVGEGCPLCSGDVFTGVLAAAVAAALGALLVAFGKRRMLAVALAVVRYLTLVLCPTTRIVRRLGGSRAAVQSSRRRTPFAFRYRPPPLNVTSS
jgi:hypothetical protein